MKLVFAAIGALAIFSVGHSAHAREWDLPSQDPFLQRALREERARQIPIDETARRATAATVQIIAQGPDGKFAQGSGVMYKIDAQKNGDTLIRIYTAAHVIGSKRSLPIAEVTGTDGKKYVLPGITTWTDPRYREQFQPRYDIGIMTALVPKGEMDPRKIPPPAKFSNDTVSNEGKPVTSLGYVDGVLHARNGRGGWCAAVQDGGFYADCDAISGMSGGPIINAKGEVIAINSKRLLDEKTVEGRGMTPEEKVDFKEYMKRVGMALETGNPTGVVAFPIRNLLQIQGYKDDRALMDAYRQEQKPKLPITR